MAEPATGKTDSLANAASTALLAADLDLKVAVTKQAYERWQHGALPLLSGPRPLPPERPGRPEKPQLLPPSQVPNRGLNSRAGRLALVHAIAHIELNAIDLALDILVRFCGKRMPLSFFSDWLRVAAEEAKHFTLLRQRLAKMDAAYGDLPAHDGLWEAAGATGHDLTARLAIVPLVLEARGLDVTPPLLRKLETLGDEETAEIFRIIYEEEKGHVAVGAKWFRFLCHREGSEPAARFEHLVRQHFRGQLKPPFNDRARAASGLTPGFYRALSPAGN